jgi:glycosyltransferase involved in cell wall biosynthesis
MALPAEENSDHSMRIAHVAPYGIHPYSGGSAIFELAAALAGQGQHVELWQLHDWHEQDTGEVRDRLVEAGVELVRIPCKGSVLRLGPEAVAAIRSRSVDVVHLHGVFSPQNNLVARRLSAPFVHSPHGGYAPESLRYHALRKQFFKAVLELPMLRSARLVFALTATEAHEIRAFGVKRPIVVIPHGVTKPPVISREIFRREVGIEAASKLAIYVGRLDVRGKRLDVLVDAIARTPEWQLALVGSDYRGGEAQLKKLIDARGLAGRIFMVGPRRGERLHQAFASGDLLLLMSRSEGLPMALLEGMTHGLPAVVSPEVAARIDLGTSSWVAGPDDLSNLLERIATESPDEWRRRREGARAMTDTYDWSLMAGRYVESYQRALGDATE